MYRVRINASNNAKDDIVRNILKKDRDKEVEC